MYITTSALVVWNFIHANVFLSIEIINDKQILSPVQLAIIIAMVHQRFDHIRKSMIVNNFWFDFILTINRGQRLAPVQAKSEACLVSNRDARPILEALRGTEVKSNSVRANY